MACVPSQQSYNFHISAQEVTGSVLAGPDGKGWRFHCCEIKGKPHIVYPVGMAESDPKAFAQLQIFSLDHDIQLIEERRKHKKLVASNLRRPWLPVLLLSISANTALAEHNTPDEHWQQELQLASEENVEQAIEDSPLPQSFSKTFQPDAQNTRQLLQILEQHYQPEEADPFNMGEELQLMASYYSQFPSVVELLHSLGPVDTNFVKIGAYGNYKAPI